MDEGCISSHWALLEFGVVLLKTWAFVHMDLALYYIDKRMGMDCLLVAKW